MSLDNKIIVGTRGSRLSLAQAEHFKDELLLANKKAAKIAQQQK